MTAVQSSPVASTSRVDALLARIHDRASPVAVVGCGYVGLPLAVAAAETGFPVLGFDVDAVRVAKLHLAHSVVDDVDDDRLAMLRRLARLRFTHEAEHLVGAEVFVLAVPTPLRDGGPDLGAVEAAAQTVGSVMQAGSLVILESTTYPGTTEEVVRPILEASSGLACGRDFGLAYAPERISPGDGYELRAVPRVVGGIDAASTAAAAAFYGLVVGEVYETRSCREAEMAKLIENTFRQVNIALVNELATVAHTLGVDIWDAIEAAATKPYGFMPFWPGPGVGGHCIAVDPSYLSWRVESRLGFGLGFVQQARAVNNRMPSYVLSRVQAALNGTGRALRDARVHVVGVSYKPGIADVRESPAIAVMRLLLEAGSRLSYSDAHVPGLDLDGTILRHRDIDDLVATDPPDVVVLLAAPPDFPVARVAGRVPCVFDAQGLTRSRTSPGVVRL